MNKLYEEILLHLSLIENNKDPLVTMLAYAKIAGIVDYGFIKDDIEEEKAKELMKVLEEGVYQCIDLLDL